MFLFLVGKARIFFHFLLSPKQSVFFLRCTLYRPESLKAGKSGSSENVRSETGRRKITFERSHVEN